MEIDDDEKDDENGSDAEKDAQDGSENEPELSYRPSSECHHEHEDDPEDFFVDDPNLQEDFTRYCDELGFDDNDYEGPGGPKYGGGDGGDEDGDDGGDDGPDIGENGDQGGDGGDGGGSGKRRGRKRSPAMEKRGRCPRCHHPNADVQDYLLGKGRSARCILCGTPLRMNGIFVKLIKEGLN